jgi:phosphatidylglycerol:prolipoprotein diacylglycerol transferase
VHPKLFTFPAFDFFGRRIPAFPLHTYGVLLAIAFLVGLWVAGREARRAGLDANRVSDLGIYVLIAGLLGAKLLLVLLDWRFFMGHPAELWSVVQSGGVFYGGLLAAFPIAWWYARRHALPGWATADALAPGVVIGQAIGRLGCFAAGCCHGRPANVPWAVTFKDLYASRTVGTPLDQPLHPTQLYESLACLAIFAILVTLAGRKRFNGQIVLTYVVLYGAARFVIEFFRGDSVRGFVHVSTNFQLSTSQVIAIVMLLAAAVLIPHVMKTQKVEPPAAAA